MAEKKPSRGHHYIPRFYLKGFSKKPNKKSKLYVYDLSLFNWWPGATNLINIGKIRDFNRIDIEGQRIDVLESSLSAFETEADKVLRKIRDNGELPVEDDFVTLINFIALIAVRNPLAREGHKDFIKRVMKQILDLSIATKERWERSVESMKETGYGKDLPDITYEKVLQFHKEGKYDIDIANQFFYAGEFNAINTVIETLLDRRWMFIVALPNAGHFICCDHPVRLRWNDKKLAEGFYPPGHGLKRTEVIFPVTKKIAMVGSFEGENKTVEADSLMVALINGHILDGSDRYIYSTQKEFEFLGPERKIYRSGDLKRISAHHK